MDCPLRCNSLKCRVQLTDRAAVTTCSHIFCYSCSESLRLNTRNGQRTCPACQTALNNPDDAVITNLSPTEDYKTSVLSGLDPSTIMECAGRALEFWSYQTLQERVYQEHLAKSLSEENKSLNTELDRMIHEANVELTAIQDKLAALQVDHETLQRKNQDLLEAFREKSRKASKTQELYDRLKKRTLLSQVQNAATATVDQAFQRSPISDHAVEVQNGLGNRASQDAAQFLLQKPSPLRNQAPSFLNSTTAMPWQSNAMDHTNQNSYGPLENSWDNAQGPDFGPVDTPSNHRQRLPLPQNQQSFHRPGQVQSFQGNQSYPSMTNAAANMSTSRARPPFGQINGNSSVAGYSGYGAGSGIKSGRPINLDGGGFGAGPRVAQRQGLGGGQAPVRNAFAR